MNQAFQYVRESRVTSKPLLQNKKKILAYNRFRKSIFAELAPKDSEVVLSDVDDIRHYRFGLVEGESSGSAQRNVLKEEFYRTALIVGGKIQLWWLYGGEESEDIDYETFAEDFRKGKFMGEYDLIDLGNIETVGRDEYFGSALWQFNKAMTHPLKSIMKMLLLKILLESHREELLCHRFRRTILARPHGEFLDPGEVGTGYLQAIQHDARIHREAQ